MHEPDPRILIVRLSHLGDVVHALPLLSAVRAAHPRARIGWAVQPEYADLLRQRSSLDEILTFDRRGGSAAWARLRADLERFGASWSIDAQGNTKSALVALASGAPRRSGFARADWAEPFAAGSLTDSAEPVGRGSAGPVHAMERMEALVRHVAPGAVQAAGLQFLPSPTGLLAGERLFDEWFGPAAGPFAVLHLAQESDVRAWPVPAFAELARDLAADHDVLVLSGPGEEAEGLAAQRSLAGATRVRCLTGQRGLPALESFLGAAACRGAVFVGCDSGPMHLAWSAGLPVVLLAGPQDERRTGPWPVTEREMEGSRGHRIVRAAMSPACAPCLARSCAHPHGPVCMSHLAPERVAAAVRSIRSMHLDRIAKG